MPTHRENSSFPSVSVHRILDVAPDCIQVLGTNQNRYCLPSFSRTCTQEHAYYDFIFLKAMGIRTVDAELLSIPHDLAVHAGYDGRYEPDSFPRIIAGWRLPGQNMSGKLLESLPSNRLTQLRNREQFLEVLFLDVHFKREGRRRVFFRQCGEAIEAIFVPSCRPIGTQTSTMEDVGYQPVSVYNGLEWIKIQAEFKSKLESLRLFQLVERLMALPEIGVEQNVLRMLWSSFAGNVLYPDHALFEEINAAFGETAKAKA